jgi:hypothetical protein
MKRKGPNPHSRFSWTRIPTEGGITYRLFRRDFNRRVYCEWWTFEGESRRERAVKLRAMRKTLLERVDTVELQELGVTT